MRRQDSSDIDELKAWLVEETKPMDFTASWPQLLELRKMLGFTDQLSDKEQIEEGRWVIHQFNKLLKRVRTKVLSANTTDGAVLALEECYTANESTSSTQRQQLMYATLRQQWVTAHIRAVIERYGEPEKEIEDDR